MKSLLVVATLCSSVGAFEPILAVNKRLPTSLFDSLAELRQSNTCTRKRYLEQTALVISSAFGAANPAFAKDDLEVDKQKLVAGYKRLNYLVDNWEQEVCCSLSVALVAWRFRGLHVSFLHMLVMCKN